MTEYQSKVCSSFRRQQHWQHDGQNQFYIDEFQATVDLMTAVTLTMMCTNRLADCEDMMVLMFS